MHIMLSMEMKRNTAKHGRKMVMIEIIGGMSSIAKSR